MAEIYAYNATERALLATTLLITDDPPGDEVQVEIEHQQDCAALSEDDLDVCQCQPMVILHAHGLRFVVDQFGKPSLLEAHSAH